MYWCSSDEVGSPASCSVISTAECILKVRRHSQGNFQQPQWVSSDLCQIHWWHKSELIQVSGSKPEKGIVSQARSTHPIKGIRWVEVPSGLHMPFLACRVARSYCSSSCRLAIYKRWAMHKIAGLCGYLSWQSSKWSAGSLSFMKPT